ncbi:multidrug ABC transporter ATP-binding protein [Yersinia enterocolitica]|uniref:ATP-binding cassette domain-containing protein n=1 Tax=Yersinia enterocolitica TaxID=630 RepID=UPI000327E1B9|nr:ATP-binding cassette domain-containing protein [Yersinia enterocolitica]AOF14444.1 multidrug ABC transporter ATP-binding protein [Yersinia enterocolitica]AOF18569.1 multidrug ABC transporter ATP-binding protein [Yersinia enterocolitica]AOF23102.1 multidrug ABC transporter ATP-binding protein [Yersinia enterocolitica]AOF26810.1 multidrug ABC transporter ATP-binding protein [Yersinia enterocolitica]AOF30923.1 multidrug ABC transporter ATP-binding protein [Yersinia enterocolitica]
MNGIPHLITLEGVEKSFPGLESPAVASLTTEIHSGAVTGLVGPDGAGKTTLLRMLAGLLKPSHGKLTVVGLDPVENDRQLHSILGYMPQKFGLYEDLTVMENLTLYADLRGVTGEQRRQTFERLLTFTDLTRFTERLAGKLSGGMKQKLGLACTLVGQPKVLLLDEPGVGVDPISRRELWRMVHELASDGMLILWSTSYLDEAEQCREVLLLNEGKLLYSGAPQELTQRMHGRTILIAAQTGTNRKLLQHALTLPQVSDGVIQGKYVRLILKPEVDHGQVLSLLNQHNGEIMEAEPRFEDAFIDLLGGGPASESALAKIMPKVEGSHDETVIEAQELTKKFGDFAATDHVNFQVKRGEIFGLLGPNGAGKSTTFKMMCGLLVPSSGKALVLGMDLKTSSGKARQHLGYMAQKFSLYGNLTVEQNLKFFSGVYGLQSKIQRDKIADMTSAFNFTPILKQTSDSLPLGFKQRLALACALMHEPEILFLDEPTSGVDPLTRREFWLHINGMVDKGVTVMVTTHFMDEAEYCDRIGLVYRGKIIAAGTPDELKQQVATDENPNPSMEEAFIGLVLRYDQQNDKEQQP